MPGHHHRKALVCAGGFIGSHLVREKAPVAICRKGAHAPDGGEIEIWGDGQETRSFLMWMKHKFSQEQSAAQ